MVGIFLALLLQSAAALSQSDDCSALLQFADSFNISEDPWMFDGKPFPRTITSWKNGTDCCSWDGVTCDHDDDVIEIDLRSSGLCGAFLSNSTLFSLRKLRRLDLNGNGFLYSDSVDSNWTSPLMFLDMSFSLIDEVKLNSLLDKIVSLKTTLQYLDLSGNPIVGEIPKSIGKLTNLQYLGLSSNTIVGEIPKSIGKLTNLQYLDLSGNTIVGEIPNSIGKLTNLQHLGLSKTSIMGSLPLTFSNLENLSYLNLYEIENLNGTVDFEIFAKMRKMNTLIFPGHQLNVVLRDSGNVSFPELTRLSLSGCNLTKFPYFLSSSKGLQDLDLSKNNITGPIPRWFWTIWNNTLDMLDLSDNLITGFLQPFTWNLRRFDLHNNMLRGPLPELLLSSVQYIDASNNFLTGLIPDCIWNLTNLQFLSFRLNHFQGLIPIPPLSLEYYSVSDNMLTGKIPSAICNSFNLAVLNLSNNSLVGSIPQCFENIRDSPLSVLNLRKNNLIGEIPSICGPYNSLQTVDLSQNNLRGTIPRSLANCTELEVVDLSSNTLNDVFPSWLAALVNLQVLVLRSNMFHGPVKYYDYEVTDPFPQLRILDISMNQFSGSLPIEYMAKFKAMMDADITTEKGNLQFISNMGYNYDDSIQVVMKGHSIELVKILKVFTTIDLSMNSFHGEIPNIVGDLKALKGLNFSHNHITGIIPSSIGNLHNLEWLDLSSNNLTGEIPKPITGLTFLTYINLSSNRLTGEIPSGPQFNTFTSDQFEGNPGLCGFPLPKPCGSLKSPPPTYHGKDDDEHDGWINWRVAVAMGYGSGLVFGLFASYLILEITFRPKCLVLWVDRMILRFERRSKKRMEVPIAAAARSGHHGR